MALTSHISNAEISANPDTGLVVGDVDPAVTQDGVITKFRDADVENAADCAANKAAFDPHDHGAAGGGQPIGTGGVIAIATNGIDNAALASSAVTAVKTQDGAIGTAEIADDTIEAAQLGAAVTKTKTVSGSGTTLFTFAGISGPPLYSIEADPGDTAVSVIPFITAVTGNVLAVGHVFGGLSVQLTCRAYGCTGIS